ncbi:Hsp70 family protein [Streptomyces qinglanensis]|uniref:Molecular chaperone DnaK n=1 Tax=Streptomyces qinglanensis TaxID=943816 RepID=A0A1H9S864_9ACTN|nr:Hsp70 family protein [Streptomyces qinglanensis]SER81151.1 molecular chaperone DnaK [Streptomyces qinglanensis]
MTGVVGIDLGTARSTVCVLMDGKPVLATNAQGDHSTPSVVAFTPDGGVLTGEAARRQAAVDPHRTVHSVRRHLGTDWHVEIDGRSHTAPQIASLLLRALKRDAEALTGNPVTEAVFTVPVGFGYAQRQALHEAAGLAGLEVLRLAHESACVGLAHGAEHAVDGENRQFVIVRLGAGSFDICGLGVDDGSGGVLCADVTAFRGDARLGGNDWDRAVADHLAGLCQDRYGVNVSRDPAARQRLWEAAETARTELSSSSSTTVDLPYLVSGPGGPVHLQESVTRAEFDELTAPLRERCAHLVRSVTDDLDGLLPDVVPILLAGGAVRTPGIVDTVRGMLPGKTVRILQGPQAATGAALQAAVITHARRDLLLLDGAPKTLGIGTRGGASTTMIKQGTVRPTHRSEFFIPAEPLPRDGSRPVAFDVYETDEGHEPRAVGQDRPPYRQRLGTVELTGLRPTASGTPQIEITVTMDADGEAAVTATALATGLQWRLSPGRTSEPAPSSIALTPEPSAPDPAPHGTDSRPAAAHRPGATAPRKTELRAGLPGFTEQQALRLLQSNDACVRPQDMPVGLSSLSCLIPLAFIAGYLMAGTGVMALAYPSRNVASPILLLPGLLLLAGAYWAKSALSRKTVAHLARAPRREEP